MNKDLSILKVKDFSDKTFPLDDELHQNIPRHPFMMVLSSSPRSGKSNCLLNLVASSNFYNIRDKDDEPYFSQIYWCSPTASFDPQVKNVLAKMDNVTVIHEPNDLKHISSILDSIIASQTKLNKENKPMERILFLMDDAIGYMNKEIALHTSKFRHFGTSMILSGQKYSKFPLLIRTCMGHFLTWKQNNGKEREKITEEIGESFCEPKEFESIMEAVTEQKYCFLYLNIEKLMMYKNFNTLLLDAS